MTLIHVLTMRAADALGASFWFAGVARRAADAMR